MALSQIPTGDEQKIKVYRWKNKSESSTTVDGATTTFTFEAVADVNLINITGINTNPTPDIYTEDSDNKTTYYTYDSGWVQKTGKLQGYDCKVYFRKNGVDYPVDGSVISDVSEGTTYIEVEFDNAPTTAVADYVLLSYAYRYVSNPEPYEYYVKEYNPKYNGRDYDVVNCLNHKVFKRRKPMELTEVSMTILKTSNSFTSTMLGDRTVSTINSKIVRNTTGGNYVSPRIISIEVDDPDDSTKKLMAIYRDIGTTSIDFSGAADSELEEKITIKCTPEQSIELEIDA